MAKIYSKNVWIDEELADVETYDIIDEDALPIYENVTIDLKTEVLQAGTQFNAAKMNNLEEGIDALDTILSEIGGGLIFKGDWDASTAAYPVAPNSGDYYLITVAGTIEATAYEVGDLILWDGAAWLKTALSKEIDFSGALVYKGVWDASGEVYPIDPITGDYYLINVAGTIDGTAYEVGDIILWNGDAWEKTALGVDVVQNLDDLGDVVIAAAADGEVLTYDGSDWVNEAIPVPTVEALATTTGNVTVDFTKDYLTHAITGNVTYASSNLAAGRTVVIRITCDGTLRNLAFPAGWKFLGDKPASIAINKVAVLSLTSFTTADAGVIAAYALEA